VRVRSEVSIHYDSLLSKLAAWGRSRSEAIDRLRRALDEYELTGIKTTLRFFRELVRDEEFIAGRLDTAFISRFRARRDAERLVGSIQSDDDEIRRRDLAMVAASIHYANLRRSSANAQAGNQPESRWKMAGRIAGRRPPSQRDAPWKRASTDKL